MTTTIKQATEQQQEGAIAVIEAHQRDLSLVLPSHVKPETWVRVAMGAVRKSADLWKACNETPGSMMNALMQAARLGLEPGSDEYYLTPRRNKAGNWEVLGIVGYQGEIELIYRAGAVSSVICELVRANDRFEYTPGLHDRPVHTVDWFGDRGDVRGAYAYAVMKDGAVSKVVVVGDERIKRAMDASGTANASHSPWKTDYGAMVLKTAAHDLQKWVPTSAEYRREQLRAERDVAAEMPSARPAGTGAFVPAPAAPFIDGEVVASEPQPGVFHRIEKPEQSPATEPQSPPRADATPQKPNKSQMNRLFKLLAEGGVTSDDGRHRLAAHVLERDITTFKDLTANDVSQLITRLEKLKAEGRLGAAKASPPDTPEPPAEQPEPSTDTEGAQQ